MKQNNHWAIYGAGLSINSAFIQQLVKGHAPEPLEFLKGKTGAIFSSATLNRFIKEEAIHDDYTLSRNEQRSIRTFSSGEQKKALLSHLLSTDPDFLILDNAFDMLDKASQAQFLERLTSLSEKITIIQVFRRKDHILPFIKKALRLHNDRVVFSGPLHAFHKQYGETITRYINKSIPPALSAFAAPCSPMIQFKNISVKHGDTPILNNICWDIRPGEFWQLVGPNGSGKTSLLTMITGNNPKAYGQDLTLFGRKKGSGESIWEIKEKIGYVTPAMTTLFNGWHTVENMVISGLYDSIGLYNKPTPLEQKLASQWIDLIGLSGFEQTLFSDLSEDRQCMVLIARAMIKHPPLLILDEPSHGLGDADVSLMTDLVNKISEESDTAIIYVSHKEEKGLKPELIYELVPGESGSEGQARKNAKFVPNYCGINA